MPTTIDLAALTPAQGMSIQGTGSVVSLASAGDVNGDGFEDIVFGVPSADGGNGRAYVVFGAASGSGNLDLANLADRGFTIFGWETSRGPARAGASVSGGGDVNGDGFDDIVIGAPGESWYDPGWAFVIYGDDSGLGPVDLDDLPPDDGFVLPGRTGAQDEWDVGDNLGWSVSFVGDVNGDGFGDVLAGQRNDSQVSSRHAGGARVITGAVEGFDSAYLPLDNSRAGPTSVIWAGDINNDGYGDAIANTSSLNTDVDSIVFFGSATGLHRAFGIRGNDLKGAGDVNGDGFDDLIWAGNRVIFGKAGGFPTTLNVSTLTHAEGFTAQGLGRLVAAGDLNDDGFADLVAGGSGGLYVIFGHGGEFPTMTVSNAGLILEGAGVGLSSSGDVNGDGIDDLIVGNGASSYVVYGSASFAGPLSEDDTIDGDTSANVFYGAGGDDLSSGYAGDDTLEGGLGNDKLYGNDGNDRLLGGEGDDALLSGNGDDRLDGNAGNDNLNAGNGNDGLDGGVGNDTMRGAAGDDSYVVDNADDKVIEAAGEGIDRVTASVDYVLTANVENLVLTGAARSGAGNALANAINGTAGDDTLLGLGGNDELRGFAGNDAIAGGDGDDTIYGDSGNDQISGEGGNDWVRGGLGSDELAGGDGDDTLMGDESADQLYGDAGNDLLSGGLSQDIIEGGEGDDTLAGDDGADRLYGDAGNDGLFGGVSNDRLEGGAGDDLLDGGDGDDLLTGGDGNDRLFGGIGEDTLRGGAGDDTYVVNSAGDTVIEGANAGIDTIEINFDCVLSANLENLVMRGGARNGTGNALANLIDGSGGNDILSGLAGNDTLWGNAGADRILGDDGDDVLIGGANRDVLTGGAGRDVFRFYAGDMMTIRDNADLIRDFDHAAHEKIQLNAIDANTTLAGNQAFAFIGNAAFSASAGELRSYSLGDGNTYVEGDANGDGLADWFIALTGTINLAATDFVL